MYFDIKQRNAKPILYLSKPDRTTIARLSEARQETEIFNGGQLNELSFVLPLKYQTLEENKKNLHAEMIRERMIIKLKEKETNQERFYVITGFNFDMDALTVTVSCKSSGYTLSDIPIKGFSTVENDHPDGLDMSSWTLSEIVRATIDRDEDTPWRLGNVDVEFDLKRREFTFDGSLGELVVSAAEKFGAVPDYDDDNYLVHFHDPENMGRNRGLKISERNYMKSLSKDTNADSMVTQLALYGKDGLTIHDVSPTGSPYIEDFSHFLYPYEEDEQGNIITSSYFMSDSLAQAMVAYNRKILSLTPTFETMLTQLNALMDEVAVQENLLADLDIELTQVQERIDIHLALNNGEPNPQFETDKTRILGEKNDVNSTINSLKSDISALAGANYYEFNFVPANETGGQIGLLKEQMLVRNNFTPAQIAERSHFIIRKEWTNDSITEAKDLLEEGRKQLQEMIKPNINFSLGLVDFLSMVETPTIHKEVYMWDEIRVEEPWNKKASTARITGITRNYDTKELTFTITNVKDNNDGTNKFLQMLYQSSFAATVVNENKYKWDKSEENAGQLNALINSNFDAIGKKVTGGVAGLTEFSARGVISRDYEDQNRYLVLQNGILATTKNGGVSWGHAITPDGIVGERIFGKILAGVNLTIEDQDGMFRVLGNKVIISNRDGREVSRLGLISQDGQPDRFGFVVDNGKNQIGIEDKDGFFISRYQGDTLEKLLWTDALGNLNAQKITATDMKIVNGDMRSAVVRDADENIIVQFDQSGMQINNGSLLINGGLTDSNIASSETWNGKETPEGAQDKADGAAEGVRTDLGMEAPLPTSIQMGTYGIRAVTSDPTKYAQLDYRGLYINGGAIQIDAGANGVSLDATNGLVVDGARAKVEINAERGFRLLNKTNGIPVFWVDTDGTLQINNVVINSGSIAWGTVGAPPSTGVETWDDLQDKPTYLEQYRIWSPEIVGGTIRSATLETGTIESSAINSATINSGETGGIGSVYIANGTILNSRRYYESLDDGDYEQINRHIKVESGKIELYGASWDDTNNITASIFIDPNFSAGSLNLKSGKWIKFTTFNQSSPIMTMSTADVNINNRLNVSSFTTLSGGLDVSFGATISSGLTVTGGLGVGGAYQNSTTPTVTSIGTTNVFVPNAVYAKGVALTSSVIYKTNIKPLADGALDVIRGIDVYEYYYQDDIDNLNFENRQIGVLAEAVPAILRGGENRSVNNYAITSLVLKGVQEQQKLIEELQERIAVLEEIQ